MASENIISRLIARMGYATSLGTATQGTYSRCMPDIGTRNIGGSFRTNHPYISGYFYVMFELPDFIFAPSEDTTLAPTGTTTKTDMKELATKWLSATCEGFTPPTDTINATEITGIGGVKARFYTSRQVSNDVTLTFREYQNLPVLNVINQWTKKFI